MPLAYPPHIRAPILERLAAGERLRDICAEAGMPDASSVRGWMRRDAGFAAEVALARVRGDFRRRFACDEAVARAALARLAAGARVGEVLADPAMPSRATWRYWLATQGWFAEEVGRLKGVKAAERALRMRSRRRAFDRAVAERVYVRCWKGERLRAVLASDPAFPSLAVFARWRREDREFDAMMRFVFDGWRKKRGRPDRGRALTPALEAAILAGIIEGGSLRSLSRRADMPCARTLYRWCRTRPDFAAAVAQACVDREDIYHDRILAIAEAVRPGGVGAARKAMAPLNAQLVRLKKRPGWKARKARSAAL